MFRYLCDNCDKPFERYQRHRRKRKFCSPQCYWSYMSRSAREAKDKTKGTPPLCACGCGKPVNFDYRTGKWRKYLSNHQLERLHEERRQKKYIMNRICVRCGKSSHEPPSRSKRYKHDFCSEKCYGEWKTRRIQLQCEYCGKIVERQPKRVEKSNHYYCSTRCRGLAWRGGKNPNWKGGYEPYYGPNWHEQRGKALERDNHICQLCGVPENGRQHDAHHIVPFREFGLGRYEEANRLENLITLCPSCHMKVENGGGTF